MIVSGVGRYVENGKSFIIAQKEADMPKVCGNCSVESAENANFCANCGASFTQAHLTGGEETDRWLSVTALRKGFRKKFDGYSDAITVELTFRNVGGKNIKAFKGSVDFFDLFETHILRLGFQVQEPLRAGSSKSETFFWEYNQFIESHQKLRFTDWDYLVPKCSVLAVIFEDGTKIA